MAEAKQTLSAATLHRLDDGLVGKVIDEALQKILTDCEDRPGLGKARKVTVEIELKPELDERSNALRGVDSTVVVKASIPATGTRTEFLYTSYDTSGKKVDAALPNSHQDGINFDSEREGN